MELSNATSIRGASMGRSNNISEPNYPVRFHLVKLKWVDGDYDKGGAYWGYTPGTSIFHAWGDGELEEQEMFVRSDSRDNAKLEILKKFPNASFYR